MEKKSKIRYVILIIAVMTGFTCIFTTTVMAKSTKYTLDAEAVQIFIQPQESWMEDDVLHIRQYIVNSLSGAIDGKSFTGHNEIYSHVKIDFGTPYPWELIINGKVTWYITLDGQVGTFYGPVNVKGLYMGPDFRVYDGKITLQGAGDFSGWKLFSKVRSVPGSDPATNIFSGTILIPH